MIKFRGTVKCQSILCPATNCANPITPPGECCPTCSATQLNSYCEYEGDRRKHPAGTTWHPYIPPWGFSKCTICTCKVRLFGNFETFILFDITQEIRT